MNNIELYGEKVFEDIKHVDESDNEFWYARELAKILEYGEYRKFIPVINKALKACEKSEQLVENHFAQVGVMVEIGSNAKRKLNDYKLTRYACYLIAQNGDPRKESIALAQTYFAVQTRKQEILESEYNELSEDEKRLYKRSLTRRDNYSLNQTAKKQELKILLDDTEDYIMEKPQMTSLKEKD